METGTLKELGVKAGDVVEYILGDRYTIYENQRLKHTFGEVIFYDSWDSAPYFRIISRASKTPKTWGEMTEAEKGALLLAYHDGKVIEYYDDGPWFKCIDNPSWSYGNAYRIKPEQKRETVTIYIGRPEGGSWAPWCDDDDTHRITFDLIDGEPDVDSIKMERI